MKKLLSITLAALMLASALTACSKASEGDWRAEVTSVLSQVAASKPKVTRPLPSTDPSITTPSPSDPSTPNTPEYTNPNAGKAHPITNADANKVPNVSYGNDSLLVYGNKVYYRYNATSMTAGNSKLWYCVDFSNLYSYDPQKNQYNQYTAARTMPLCMSPFCRHTEYQSNNGYVCPLYFDNHRLESVTNNRPIYCIDYTESNGAAPVFYILAAEPEYKIVGEQVIKNTADDYAIYRYDTAVGKREIIAEKLPTSAKSLTICGEYIYYYSIQGLTAINKKGEQVGNSESVKYILGYENGKLYLSDVMGKVYTANKNLSNLKQVFTVDTSALTEVQIVDLIKIPNTPFGYRIVDGYLYYVNDYEKIYQSEKYEYIYVYVTSIYRVPLNDLSAEPELILDKQCYSGKFYGVTGNKLYYIPAYNIGAETYFINGYNLGCVNLTTKEVTVMEEAAFSMPHYSAVPEQTAILTSNFLIGLSPTYGLGYYLVLYDFETVGELMFISASAMFGKVPLPE